ncbi:MAG: LPD7 domain-containing protein, partial [Acetobacteraceae bacterium]
MAYPELRWLPADPAWPERLAAAEGAGWAEFVALARTQLDFLATERLDRALRHRFPDPPDEPGTSPLRLALLGSATLAHLKPALRIAAQKFDLEAGLDLTGGEEFRTRAAEIAGRLGYKVQNPDLQ